MFIHEQINYELKRIKIGERRCDIIFFNNLAKGEEDIFNNEKYKEKL
jgi:hypothetical protein